MPESPFTTELSDGSQKRFYSPSSVVKKYFTTGQTMTVSEFQTKATEALTIASERVQQKLGFT